MMNKNFTFLTLFLTLTVFYSCQKDEPMSGTAGSLTWTISDSDKTLTISGNGEMPNYKRGYSEFEIVRPWNIMNIAAVVINDGATSIGDYAFTYCFYLTSATIPNSVKSIGDWVFWGCSSLKSITIPNTVASIGEGAFGSCRGLTSVEIPNSVKSIGDNTFAHCDGLTSINIPSSVTSIGNGAFAHCNSLTSITIPNSVTSVGNSAFAHCYALESITIPSSVTSIGFDALGQCHKLTEITNESTTPQSIDRSVFSSGYVDLSTCTLRVPAGSIDDYRKADVWKEFGNITAI